MTNITLTNVINGVADTLEAHGVFFDVYEMPEFKFIVSQNAKVHLRRVTEITYRGKDTRVLVYMMFADGEPTIERVRAVPHPNRNENIDYDKLNAELASVVA